MKNPNLNDADPVRAYDQLIEDLDYSEQQMLIYAHMSPEEFENTDYPRLVEIMNARPRDKRPKTLWEFAEEIDKKGGK